MDGWLLYGGRLCGSHEGMIIVVAIDTEYGNHLLVTMREAETVEKALASDVTSKFQPTQVGHSGCIAGWLLYGRWVWCLVCGELSRIKMVGSCSVIRHSDNDLRK